VIKNTANDKEKIRKLYHYLQDETRYINVTINIGGLKPYPASYVAKNKYGDCKALTNYFKSILDYIEIPSYYTKVYAGSPINKIDKNFPSQQSNHIILYIPLKGEDIWLDCTSDGAFDYLGTFTQNRDAFIVDLNNSKFIKTPNLKPIEVLETRNIKINYNPNYATVKFTNTYKGNSYENILNLEKNYNESEKSRILRNYIVEDGFQLIDYNISYLNRDSVEIKVSYNAATLGIYNHYGNDILLNNIAFPLPNFEMPNVRKLPVQIDYPISLLSGKLEYS
jgi:transglutaminase-like putative cysteine protease